MTTHRPILSTGGIYHIFNRSIAKEYIFDNNILKKMIDIVDFYRYQNTIKYSNFLIMSASMKSEYLKTIKKVQPLVEIYSFCFMPNHYHFLIRQLADKGISLFISNIQNSYAKYFNLYNKRHGSVFQTGYKSKMITNNSEFIHVGRYIHLNPVTSKSITFNQLKTYPFTSFSWYLNCKLNRFISVDKFLNNFKNIDSFIKFHSDQINYQIVLKQIKDLLFE